MDDVRRKTYLCTLDGSKYKGDTSKGTWGLCLDSEGGLHLSIVLGRDCLPSELYNVLIYTFVFSIPILDK